MPLMKVVSGLVPNRWRRGYSKHQKHNIKQLEMKLKLVFNKRDALKEEIMKELVRGEMPSREFRIWLDKGESIENKFDKLKAQTEGSVLDTITAQKLEDLTSMLANEIVKYLEVSPFDHSQHSKSQHKTASKVRRSWRVKPQAKAKDKAGAGAVGAKTPFKILVHDNLVQKLKNKASAQAQLEEVKESGKAVSYLAMATEQVQVEQLITGTASKETSTSNPNIEAALTKTEDAKTIEQIATSTFDIQDAQADIVPSVANVEAAEPVSIEMKDKRSSESTLPSFLEVEMLQPLSILEAKSHIASSENGHLISPEPRLKANKSVQNAVQQIIGSKAKIIGLYGQGGIGKTSIVRALIDDPKVKDKFDPIIWVTVSRFWSSRKIRDEIARQLPSRPGKSKDKFLLILDDVWEKIDLNEVGIPVASLENGCRLIMTTRSVELCRDMAAKEIQVGSLSTGESWELFREQVGQSVDSPDIKPYARGIVKESGGLPLSLIVAGKALYGETDVSAWKMAFKYFLLPKNGEHGSEPLIQQLSFGYERLKIHARKNPRLVGSNLQICFLYCAHFPEDYQVGVSNLVEYWIQEGLITGNLIDAHKMGHAIVEILIDAAILERSRDRACVRMHGILRDLASSLISAKGEGLTVDGSDPLSSFGSTDPEGHEHFFRAGAGLTEPPPEKEWEVAKMISLEDNDISSLPASPNCPKLLTLSLQRNPRLRVLPVSFFELMPYLEVLNMSKTRITSLPESISKLRNLKQLNLRDCERLTSLPSEIGELKCIELLDLHGTVLNSLPEAVGKLESLKDLEVSFYGPLDQREYSKLPPQLISSGIISNLHRLNNLSIVVIPGDQRWNDIAESVIEELSHLSNLTSLRFYFSELRHLQLFLQTNKSWKNNVLKKFRFIVGLDNKRMLARVPHDVELDYYQQDRCLRLVNKKMPPQEDIKEVLTRTTSFYLDHHLKISSLSQFGGRNIIRLEFCIVRECPEIEYITNDGKEVVALPFLEHLSLHYLEKLKGVWNWKNQLPCGSFASLKSLSVHTCRKLEFVLTSSMSQYVPNLEELVVEDCQAIKNIIGEPETNSVKSEHIMLPKLKSLRLSYLPSLISIWKGKWPSLENVSFYCCPKLNNLSMGCGSELKSSIKEIKAEEEWWGSLEWDDISLYSFLVNTEICKWL
ncbi:Disease resistance protein At4g27190 [Euphorbia peplus]|nr:Disease resistance protein At4g27190 [Euphorbia peplus]